MRPTHFEDFWRLFRNRDVTRPMGVTFSSQISHRLLARGVDNVMQPEHARILEQIRTAFPSIPISADGAFGPLGTSYPDARSYKDQLEGMRWDQLDRAYMVRRSDVLGFLAPLHFASVLPVYLVAMVEDGVWSPATEMLTLVLARPSATNETGLGLERFDALISALTNEQLAAVAMALRAFADQDPNGSLGQSARACLDGHWERYLPASV